jgi:hypothetical protein
MEPSQTLLDLKCGLLHQLSHGQTSDALFDVKLVLTSFDVRKKIDRVKEDVLAEPFVEKARFRLWAGSGATG